MIRLCIFDLGGTIIDKYSLSPFISLKNAFKNNGIDIHNSLIFKDMGKNKKEHVDLILCDNYVQKSWYLKHGRFPNKADSQLVYNEFNRYQLNEGIKNMEILPETRDCIKLLNKNSISTGVTTGFNKPITMNIRDRLFNQNIFIGKYVSSTCLKRPGRPHPYMINHIMDKLSITNPKTVIKVDDTVVGIEEGKQAGCITVGVAKWSTNMMITSYNEVLTKEQYVEKIKNSRRLLNEAEPDFVITSLDELYPLIETINYGYL